MKEQLEKIQAWLEQHLVQANTGDYLNSLRGTPFVRNDDARDALIRSAKLHAAVVEYIKGEYPK